MKSKEWHETGQSTLMNAFIYLTRCEVDKEGIFNARAMKLDRSDNEALRFLMRRLDMTSTQVHILACIIYHSQGLCRSCDVDDLTSYIGSHPLELLSRREDFDELTRRGYLEEGENHMDAPVWNIRREAMIALGKNEPFDVKMLRAADAMEFFAQCTSAIREGSRYDRDGEIEKQISWLFELNAHLPVTRVIREMAGEDELVFKPLVLCASLLATEAPPFIESDDFNMILDGSDVRRITRSMKKGTHRLVKNKILEPYCTEDGLATAEQWIISKNAWMELLGNDIELVNAVMSEKDDLTANLKRSKDIPECPLFFSGKTLDEVSRLRKLLQEDQYRAIIARLKEKNMPTGFSILLYGVPGTGKTELVQQLARETGRDIFAVDMAQIRDKYVGESEQNLARIFDTYRAYVKRMSKTPILFCNECDAIFGSRLERTNGSVDKMENALQNILLEQMEKLQGIMICTTNLTSALDKAFERRFLIKLQLPKPGNETRKQIWTAMMPDLSEEQVAILAERYDFSGGQIQNVTRKQIINAIFSGSDETDFSRILDDCNAETMDRTNGHPIGF